eukprot:8771732-Pyramimonas_sp.AAC.1
MRDCLAAQSPFSPSESLLKPSIEPISPPRHPGASALSYISLPHPPPSRIQRWRVPHGREMSVQ